MVQNMDSAAADSVARLLGVSNALRAHGFEDSADQIATKTNEIYAIISVALNTLGTGTLFLEDSLSPSTTPHNVVASTSTTAYTAPAISEPKIQAGIPQPLVALEGIPSGPARDNMVKNVEVPAIHPEGIAALNGASAIGTPSQHITQPAPATTAPALVRIPEVGQPMRPLEIEKDEEAGELFLDGNFNLPNAVHFVTSQIHEGPLFEVIVSVPEKRATIVFQRAFHAGNFLRRNEEMMAQTGFTVYGKSYTVTAGPVIPWDDRIRAMGYPYRERRRLTFARAGLFTGKLTPDQFRADMNALVGQENVEIAWVFNAGNATVIFRSVGIAREVYQYFRGPGGKEGKYADADVTYSSDPCEKPVVYSTQLQDWQPTPRDQQLVQPVQRRVRRARKPKNAEKDK